jgi:hypothetical protein
MSKGFLFFLAGLIGLGYFIRQHDPSGKALRGSVGGGGAAISVEAGTFDRVVMGPGMPVIAYFWAPW